ncbi:hypothetical protein Ahia01_000616500 [Argonauta hians]
MADVQSEDESSMCISDMNILKTRASEFTRNQSSSSQASPQSDKQKKGKRKRKESIIKCREHHETDSSNAWSALNSNCDNCFKYVQLSEVKHGVLPRVLDAVNLVLSKKAEAAVSQTKSPIRECAIVISLQWVRCNLKNLFDIPASDSYRKLCEANWNAKISKEDFSFYSNQQKCPPIGYCSSAIDRNWDRSMKRKQRRENRTRNEQLNDSVPDGLDTLVDDNDAGGAEMKDCKQYDPDFVDTSIDENGKRKYQNTF